MYLKIEQTTPLSEQQRRILAQIKAAPQPIRGRRPRWDHWPWVFWPVGVIVDPSGIIRLDCWELNTNANARYPNQWRRVNHISPSEHELEGVDLQ